MELGIKNIKKHFLKFLVMAFFAVGIFAFSSQALAGPPSNNVYYSVGQSAADLKTGTPTVTITSGTAVFSVAQTGNIGVGDRVTYNTSTVAYISAKMNASGTNWNLVTATGAVPANISNSTVVSIKHEYTSLSAAVAGAVDANHLNTTNLTLANVILNFPCYYDSAADTTAVTVSGFTTSAANYIKIYTPNNTTTETNNSQRHGGRWDDGRYNLTVSTTYKYALSVQQYYTQIIGLQVRQITAINGYGGIQSGSAGARRDVLIDGCIVTGNGTGSGSSEADTAGIYMGGGAKVLNSVVYGMPNSGIFFAYFNDGIRVVYNSTVYGNGTRGINASAANGDSPYYIKNVLMFGNVTGD